MSKYIKLEDAIEKCKTIAGAGYKWLSDLPTIEVSEDCISREWLVKDLNDYAEIHGTCCYLKIDYLKRLVENAPSAVPTVRKNRQVERAEGEWIDWLGKGNEWECSECKCSIESHGSITYNYCPNCGSRMKGAE